MHGTDHGGHPWKWPRAMPVLDLILMVFSTMSPNGYGARPRPQRIAEALSQRDRRRAWKGLMSGIKVSGPVIEFVNATLAEVTIPASDNVVPLTGHRSRSRVGADPAQRRGGGQGRARHHQRLYGRRGGRKHFLDLSEVSAEELRRILSLAVEIKGRAQGSACRRAPRDRRW